MTRILLLCLLLHGSAFSFDSPNHIAISEQTAAKSAKLKRQLSSIFLSLATDVDGLNTSNVGILDLIKQGSKEEDGWKEIPLNIYDPNLLDGTLLRTTNHFYDPYYLLALDDPCDGIDQNFWGVTAVDWALSGDVGLMTNAFSLPQLRNYLYRGLTASNRVERKEYLIQYFKGLGHFIHLLQDMAVPAHVRNDNHGPNFIITPNYNLIDIGADRFELYKKINVTGQNETALEARMFDSYEKYWHNSSYSGLADFTNRNFASQDTNLDHRFSECRKPLTYQFPAFESFYDSLRTIWNFNVNVRFYVNTVNDLYSGENEINRFLSVSSFWNFITADYYAQRVFSLNEDCHAMYAHFLVPRATAYSIGLLDFMFRGKLRVTLEQNPALENQKIILQNLSDNNEAMTGGEMTFVAHYLNDPDNQEDDSWTSYRPFSLDFLENAAIDSQAKWIQYVQISNFDAVHDLTAIYQGGLGQESNEIIAIQHKIEPYAFLKIDSAAVALQDYSKQSQGSVECQLSHPYNSRFGLTEMIEEPYDSFHYIGTMKYFHQAKLQEIDLRDDCSTLIVDGIPIVKKWTRTSSDQPNPEHLEIVIDRVSCPDHDFGLSYKLVGNPNSYLQGLPGAISRVRKHVTNVAGYPWTNTAYPDCRCIIRGKNNYSLSSMAETKLSFGANMLLSINGQSSDSNEEDWDSIDFRGGHAFRTITNYVDVGWYASVGTRTQIDYHALSNSYISYCHCAQEDACWQTCQEDAAGSISEAALEAEVCPVGTSMVEEMDLILEQQFHFAPFPSPMLVQLLYPYPQEAWKYGYEHETLTIDYSMNHE